MAKNCSQTLLTLGLLGLAVLISVSHAVDLQWHNFTSFKYVRQMRVIDDTLYMATSGGILAVTGFEDGSIQYIGSDGLGSNNVTDIIKDAGGQKWATAFGRLVRFDGGSNRQYLFVDRDENLLQLHGAVDDGDFLWVGTGIGLVLFSKMEDGGQIQDSYQQFADLQPDPAVYDIAIEGDSIWLATSNGLAAADRTDRLLLKSPSTWSGFDLTSCPELGTDTVMDVVRHQSETYIATRRGVWRVVDDGVDCFESVPIPQLTHVYDLELERDTLFVFVDDSAGGNWGYIDAGAFTALSSTGLPSEAITGTTLNGHRWVATGYGVFSDEAGGGAEFVEYPYTGLPDNDITDIAVDDDGNLTAGFKSVAMARFEDSVWSEYDLSIRQAASVVMVDSSQNVWMCTIGNGIFVWDGDTLRNYDETNSMLRGVIDPNGETFVIITGIETDGRYLFISNYRALNDFPVVIADLDNLDDLSGWDSVGAVNGFSDIYAGVMDLYRGQLAVATEFSGVFVCDVEGDPSSDNVTCQQFTRENSLLASNNVRTVQYSPDGELWVGTNFGLSWYDRGIDRFVDVDLPPAVSSDVTGLAFDGRGNLWIGTKNGLLRRDAVTGDMEVFNTFNSGLVSDEINAVTCDRLTYDVYVATKTGFSFIPSTIGRPVADVTEVAVYPNPFVITGDDDVLRFNFGREGVIRIFTVAGDLVREMAVGDWDGNNQDGLPVASGVYIFVITDNDGNVGKGKVLLVRQ